MVGLFDSGCGGLNTVRYVKELYPDVDLLYFIDRERAPYGVKTEKELVEIASENIERLSDAGAEQVLIACCTASTVHRLLDERLRKISIPIIDEVAKYAKNSTRLARIGVIATEHTVRSHAFARALEGISVCELALPELVRAIDSGLSDQTATGSDEEHLREIMLPVLESNADTLILGCTHFPAVIKTVERIARPYGINTIVDSARIGADVLARRVHKSRSK